MVTPAAPLGSCTFSFTSRLQGADLPADYVFQREDRADLHDGRRPLAVELSHLQMVCSPPGTVTIYSARAWPTPGRSAEPAASSCPVACNPAAAKARATAAAAASTPCS
jgi:hypothetical protein